MDDQQLYLLMEKFLEGTATDSEKNQLDEWYASQNAKDVIWETKSANEERQIEAYMRNRIKKHIRSKRPQDFNLSPRMLGKVAAVLVGLSVIAGFLLYKNNANKSGIISASVTPVGRMPENNYILLPDSSTVLLHPGSKIQYTFNKKVRELTLVGEAYFDIKHKDVPFIIHTGKIITQVLGTAFNIKAYSNQKVVVSVTRGKVSVIDGAKKILAVLTPNQAMEYSEVTQTAKKETVDAEKSIAWVKSDMQFDDMPFKQVAEKLSRRYGVDIEFKNPEVEKCLVNGGYSGTEPLDKLLHFISDAMATTYIIDNGKVLIDGKGCQ